MNVDGGLSLPLSYSHLLLRPPPALLLLDVCPKPSSSLKACGELRGVPKLSLRNDKSEALLFVDSEAILLLRRPDCDVDKRLSSGLLRPLIGVPLALTSKLSIDVGVVLRE